MHRIVIAVIALALAGCVNTDFHFIHWDYIHNVGWRPMLNGQQQNDCFDEQSGDTLLACQGCYDINKQPIPGCTPGHYEVSPEKAARDAKIVDQQIHDFCRLTVYGCRCNGLAYPWTAAQKKIYPSCDPRKPQTSATKGVTNP